MRSVFLFLALFTCACSGKASLPVVKDGDIIFHTSNSAQSLAIQRATGSKYSHMGLVVHRDGRPFVFEAINTVQFTPLDRWIARGNTVRAKMQERYGSHIPLDEPVISPAAMLSSPLLITIVEQ